MHRIKTLGVVAVVLGVGAPAAVAAGQSTAVPPDRDLVVQGDVWRLTEPTSSSPGAAAVRSAAADSEVRLSWIPGLAEAEVGDVLRPVTVAVTRTDPAGRYRLRVNPTAIMRDTAATNGGWVSFDVSVAVEGQARSTSVSRRLVDGSWTQASPRAGMAGGPAPAADPLDTFGSLERVDFSFTPPVAASRDVAPAARIAAGRESGEVRFAEPSSSSPIASLIPQSSVTAAASGSVPCSFVVTGTPQRSARVLRWHNAGNSNASWTYGTSADSDLDVAFDASGDGTWSLRGGFHVGNSQGTSVHQSVRGVFNQYARTSFRWTEGYYRPYGLGSWCNNDPSIPVNSKRKTATKWVGGVANDAGSGSGFRGCFVAPQNAHRRSYPAGSGLRKASSRASRIGISADVGPINVGGSSGYSTQLDVVWNSVRGNGIYLCGTRDDVTGSPGVIHAQNR